MLMAGDVVFCMSLQLVVISGIEREEPRTEVDVYGVLRVSVAFRPPLCRFGYHVHRYGGKISSMFLPVQM